MVGDRGGKEAENVTVNPAAHVYLFFFHFFPLVVENNTSFIQVKHSIWNSAKVKIYTLTAFKVSYYFRNP